MKSTKKLRDGLEATAVHVRGAIRRMAIKATAKVLWELTGFRRLDGTNEEPKAEAFTGIGFYARPPSSSQAEAIVLMVGDDSTAPVVVATRDEKTRAAIAGGLAENETAMFNSAALVHIKADGSIEARSKSGVAVPLATKADLEYLRDAILAHAAAGVGFGAALNTDLQPPNVWPVGTSKLKGE